MIIEKNDFSFRNYVIYINNFFEKMETKLDCMYKLTKNFEDALKIVDEDWVLTKEAVELIAWAKMEITQKTENIFKLIRTWESQIDAMKDEKSYINSKQNSLKKNVAKLRELIELWLDTVWAKVDKKWKKTQSIKTNKWTAFYKFQEKVEFDKEKIDKSYIEKKKKLNFSDDFTMEKLQEVAPELVEEVEYEEIDYEKLEFDYRRAKKKWEDLPEWIDIIENKTLSLRK